MIPNIDIQLIQPENLQLLHTICCDAYSQNFAHHWEEGGLENYLDDTFGIEKLRAELLNDSINYYVAFTEEQPVAFMKLNLASNLPGLNADEGIELDKVYILPAFKGKRIGFKLHSKTRIDYPKFKDELKGMWRMFLELS